MKKKQKRKKQLKHRLARLKKTSSAVAETVAKTAQKTVEAVVDGSKEVVEDIKRELSADDFDYFAAELEGVSSARLETFYKEGIQSVSDFATWTKEDLLALKGIGPATIKQLEDKGVHFKA